MNSYQLDMFDSSSHTVTARSSWRDVLDVVDPVVRRQRWEQWKTSAEDQSPNISTIWTDTETCAGCMHLNGDWCALQELPCTYNPYLTQKTGMVGMACMGLGFKLRPGVGA